MKNVKTAADKVSTPKKNKVSKSVKPKAVKLKTTKAPVKPPVDIWKTAKSFIGIKQITAIAMTLGAYNKYRDWVIPSNEDPKKAGFVVKYPDGYVSWSPKEIFDNSYMTGTNLDFSAALYMLKRGDKLTRKGWNGKKMWIVYVPGKRTANMNLAPYISMKTVSGKLQENNMQPGWLASQADMLATDWAIVIK